MHVDASDIYPSTLVFYTRHRVNIMIYQTVNSHTDMCLQTLTYIQLKNLLWTTVAFLRCCNLIWGLANNNYSLYFLQFLTITQWQFMFVLYFHSLLYCTPTYSWTIEQIERDIVLLLKITHIWVITICVVLDHNTVIFQKEKGGGGTYKNPWYARLPIVKVDRNKNVTLNRCP
jgi:hypothetical protein